MSEQNSPSTIMLVHGAWHTNSCWHLLTPLLEDAGFTVLTPALPGHVADKQDHKVNVSFRQYVTTLQDIVAEQSTPIVVVGHSMAGMLISQLAENIPDKIAGLIYLCAYLPQNEESLFSLMEEYQQKGDITAIEKAMQYSDNNRLCHLSSDSMEKLFYCECNEALIKQSLENYCPQPVRPLSFPVKLSLQNFGRIPRHYIKCENDKVIPPELQQWMLDRQQSCKISSLPAGHSPFLSCPDSLARIINNIVRKPPH